MSSGAAAAAARKAWFYAAAIGAVEALKDQGICRWNYTMRSLHQHVKNNIRTYSQQAKTLSPSSAAASNKLMMMKSQEEKMRKIMDLSCLGPNTIRL